jgi:hypothetical protein
MEWFKVAASKIRFFLLDQNQKKKKQHKVNGCIIIVERDKWIDEALEECMDTIESGTIY